MSMFSSHTLITGGIITQTHGNIIHVYGAPEGALSIYRLYEGLFDSSNKEQDPWALFNGPQLRLLSTTLSNASTPKCHPNTRVAVLDKILRWVRLEENVNSQVMWVYGPAGSGKSAITHTIDRRVVRRHTPSGDIFFSRSDPSRNSIRPLAATIAYQIYSYFPDLRDSILGALE